jgi:hypothetical protein
LSLLVTHEFRCSIALFLFLPLAIHVRNDKIDTNR